MSRVYVFESYTGDDGKDWGLMRYEWLAEGVPSQMDGSPVRPVPYEAAGYGRWIRLLGRGEPVYGNTREFPENERWALREEGILSIVAVPIFTAGRWWGHIGFDETRGEREWSRAEVSALGAAAGTLGAAIRRKRVDEELRASEAELRAVFGAMNDVILVLDGDGRYLKVAPTTYSWLYRPPEDLVGKTVHDTFPREQAHKILGSIRRALESQQRVDIEYDLPVGDDEMWFAATISPMTENSVVAVARDITERKKNEDALRQSEKLYRAVIEQATENILLIDVETRRIVESNPAFRKALGYSEEELAAMTIYDVVAADRESVDENVRRISERRGPDVGERQYRRKDGTLLHVEVSASLISRDGRETICAVAHDVTERARLQALLEERVATLSGMAADLVLDLPMEGILDALASSVVRASTAGSCLIVLIDDEADSIRLVGSHGVPEGYEAAMQAAYEKAGDRSPNREAFRTRRPVLFRDARRKILANPRLAALHKYYPRVPWDTIYVVPLVSRGGALGAISFGYPPGQEPGEEEKVFLGAVADQAAVAVENARLFSEARGKAALEERQKLARELHDSVSQALYGIALGANTAREEFDDNPAEVPELLDYVLSLAEAGMAEMRALIFELRPESLEAEGVVAALEKQAAALQARHGTKVETDLCDEPTTSLETKEAVYRIAQETLHNTAKHARAGNVRMRMRCAREQITLEISDDGVGFDPRGDFPGHLGLRSMRERAQRVGGTLEIQSASGAGTRIDARIPL